MKEFTIEQKAKAYDEAIERAKEINREHSKKGFKISDDVLYIFPELRESKKSEDELHRKWILEYLYDGLRKSDEQFKGQFKCAIAWLEKQGEKKSIWHNEDEEPKRDSLILLIMQSGTPIVAKIIEPNHTFNHGERWAYIDDLLEKQGEKDKEILILKDQIESLQAAIKAIKEVHKIELEKQGNLMKALQISNARIGELIEKNYYLKEQLENQGKNNMGISEATKKKLENNLNKALEKETPESCNEFLEEQGEQKHVNKVEPKFKVGNWIVKNDDSSIHIDYSCCKITKVENGNYTIESIYGYKGYNTFETFEKDYHLWTIQNVKDGDVIYSRHNTESFEWIGIFKSLDKENKRAFFYGFWYDMAKTFSACGNEAYVLYGDFSPATKEQRDILFQKMREAGYEWDAEKKELKKLEQKLDWSKEDERMIDTIIYDLERHGGKEDSCYSAEINWLKSIKDRIQPQPKQEWDETDMDMLESIIKDSTQRNSLDPMQLCWLDSLTGKHIPQPKQEWGEEDEKMIDNIIDYMMPMPIFFKSTEGKSGKEYTKEFIKDATDWLKSLKGRYTWKPSDEQIKALDEVYKTHGANNVCRRILFNLMNDLKKLREE